MASQQMWCLGRTVFSLHPHVVERGLFFKGTNPIHEGSLL